MLSFVGVASLLGCVLLSVVLLSGCTAPKAWIHPALKSLDIERVGLWRVENATVEPLDHVEFGGMLQRGLLEPRVFDMPGLLHASLRKVLNERGYDPVELGKYPKEGWRGDAATPVAIGPEESPDSAADAGAPGGAEGTPGGAEGTPGETAEAPPVIDARMRCRIVSWNAQTGSLASFRMFFKVELESADGEHQLYHGTFQAYYRESSARRRSHTDIPRALRAAAREALAGLPSYKKGGKR